MRKSTYFGIAFSFAMLISVIGLSSIGASGHPDLQVPDSVVEAINANKNTVDTYIVLMVDDPVVAYDGDIAGYEATKVAKGNKVNPNSANVKKYTDYLKADHETTLQSVGADYTNQIYDYTFAINGFSAQLTGAQADALALRSNVANVQLDQVQYIDTDASPDFLGLTGPGGAYAKGYDGEGIVIGVIDTGINPEHPSFADDGSYGPAPTSFTGTDCDFGNTAVNPDDAPFTCNNKLLAAKSYRTGSINPWEYLSARDFNGHGSHTASTSGGNAGVEAIVERGEGTINLGTISGIAPRARISVYKALWDVGGGRASGSTTDLVAAIDQAVEDGVDVINYSISSGPTLADATDVSFLFAAVAGVSVASSNGNDGPDYGSSAGKGPWDTRVGASTHNREFPGTVTLGDGSEFFGPSVSSGTDVLSLVDSADHGNELCDPSMDFTPSVEGKMVLCRRGIYARVDKSLAVFQGGGTAMILYNPTPASLNADLHSIPSIHVDDVAGPQIKSYIASAGASATAKITAEKSFDGQGSVMADFSSRGPMLTSEDIITPDVTAPGLNILAAVAPGGNGGDHYAYYGGTSMSAPHVAGLFALISQAHPEWSPAIAKSALMTTSRQDVTKEDSVTPADPFDMGAGHVDPSSQANKGSFLEPGLAYDAGLFEYAAYTCGINAGIFSQASCNFLEAIGVPTDPSDFNSPSIGIAELVGSQTITRTVTSVAEEQGWRTYTVSVEAPAGYSVSVSPSAFSIKNGQSVTYEVTITNDGTATIGDWAFGSLTWTSKAPRYGNQYDVYSPIAVRGFEIDFPSEVNGFGTEGALNFDAKFGFAGTYSALPHNLVEATITPGNVLDDPTDSFVPFGPGTTLHFINVPAGSVHARFALFDEFTSNPFDDLDLYVYHPSGAFAGVSGSGSSTEQVDVAYPMAGDYYVFVHGWETDGPDSDYELFSWAVTTGPGGNLSVDSSPSSVSVGQTATIDVSWSGLTSSRKYLGAVSHNTANLLGYTLINVES